MKYKMFRLPWKKRKEKETVRKREVSPVTEVRQLVCSDSLVFKENNNKKERRKLSVWDQPIEI